MGTRADFYIHETEWQWLGSVALDGYQWAVQPEHAVRAATTAEQFACAVDGELSRLRHAARPADGWPWPWENSNLTDYAYVFEGGRVNCFNFGHPTKADGTDEGDEDTPKRSDWPDMTSIQNVTFGGRSGLLVVGFPAE